MCAAAQCVNLLLTSSQALTKGLCAPIILSLPNHRAINVLFSWSKKSGFCCVSPNEYDDSMLQGGLVYFRLHS